jgi:hypothetical protein
MHSIRITSYYVGIKEDLFIAIFTSFGSNYQDEDLLSTQLQRSRDNKDVDEKTLNGRTKVRKRT